MEGGGEQQNLEYERITTAIIIPSSSLRRAVIMAREGQPERVTGALRHPER